MSNKNEATTKLGDFDKKPQPKIKPDLAKAKKKKAKSDQIEKIQPSKKPKKSLSAFEKIKAQYDHPWYQMSNDDIRLSGSNMLQVTYDFYDQLMQDFPEHVSYEVIGLEYTGLEIREYWIKPRSIGKMRIAPQEINNFPTVLLISGQHGQEYGSSVNLMLMLYEMFYHYKMHDNLSLLRASFNLRIVPCLNAWGVANVKRTNSRHVDINRNFSLGWEKARGNKGETALSEIESQILINWVKKYKDQTLCFINLHDHSDLAVSWGCASHPFSQRVLFQTFQKFSVWYHRYFQDKTPDVDLTWLGIPRDGYSDKYIGELLDVPTVLMETPYINHPKISDTWLDTRLVSLQLLTQLFETLMQKYYQA